MNVTIMLTWYSTIFPLSERTCCSLIQAPRAFPSVFEARARPCWMASSKLLGDVALSSETFATDIASSFVRLNQRPIETAASLPGRDAGEGPVYKKWNRQGMRLGAGAELWGRFN